MLRFAPSNFLSTVATWCISQLLLLNKQFQSSLAYNSKHVLTLWEWTGLKTGSNGSASDLSLCFSCSSWDPQSFHSWALRDVSFWWQWEKYEKEIQKHDFYYGQGLEQVHYCFLPCSIDQSKSHGQAHINKAGKYSPSSGVEFKVTWTEYEFKKKQNMGLMM